MDFDLTEAQQEIVQGVRAMCERFNDEYWRAKDAAREFPHDFYQAVAKAGYLGVAIPEEFGGSGTGHHGGRAGDAGGRVRRRDERRQRDHLSIFGLTPIVMHGTEEMKRRHLPRVVSGELHAAFAVTEPDAGNDITHIKTFARREGDNYVINGRKVFTTKAQEAHKMLLLTRTTPFEQVAKKTEG